MAQGKIFKLREDLPYSTDLSVSDAATHRGRPGSAGALV
jgi:hypothetical protein